MPISLSRPLLILLAAFVLLLSLDGMWDRKLANPDEGRYSEIAREMALSGDFVTPRLNGLKYFEKPPLQYWATAISMSLFGVNEFAARLYTVLCGLGCLLLVAYTGRRLFDAQTGIIAALILLSAPYFAALSEVVTLDMGLTFWMTLSFCAFAIAQSEEGGWSDASSRRRWMLVAWAGMAGAVLSKGLVGIVFPAAGVFLYCAVHRDLSLLRKLEWLRGLAVFFVFAAPWFVLVSMRNPEFPQFFFVHEHFQRFLTPAHRRVEVWWYFFPILLVGFLPWLVAFLPACMAGWRHPGATGAFRPLRFFLLSSAFVLIFFSKSSSKLPAYILPIFPILAVVLAAYLRKVPSRQLAWMVLPISAVALYGAYAASRAPARRAEQEFARLLFESMSVWVVGGVILIAAAIMITFFLLRAERKWLGILVISISTMVGIEAMERGYERISPLQSGAATAIAISAHLTPETRLYSVLTYDQSLPVYLKRTLTLVEYVDEFELGQQQEPTKVIAKVSEFVGAWSAPGPAIAIIQPHDLDNLRAMGLRFEIIHQDPRRIALKKTAS